MLSFFLTKVVCSIVGIAWPGYMSFRSLETFDPNDEKQWLTYWVIFACLETVEVFGYWFLLWIPLYYELKLAFIVWLIAPGTRGAEVLYTKFVWKVLHEYGSKFDPTFRSDNKAPPELHAELFKQAQQYVGQQGTTVEDFKASGFNLNSVFGTILGKR